MAGTERSRPAPKPPAVCIVGPTACGKNDLALALADHAPVAVVNLDSRQVYRDFPIITAQPSAKERRVCPHLLYGFLGLEETIHAGRYVDLAREAMGDVTADGRLPALVGGTGMYLRSLVRGLAPVPAIPEDVRRGVLDELEASGPQRMHGELARVDPESAARIHPNDKQRIARATEVLRGTGRPLSWWRSREHPVPDYDFCLLGLSMEKEELHRRIEVRVSAMLDAGALDEARRARAMRDDPAAPGWTGIGCAELLAYLRGEMSLAEAEAQWIGNTKAYAKRQMTWFRKEKDIHWLPASDPDAALAGALELMRI